MFHSSDKPVPVSSHINPQPSDRKPSTHPDASVLGKGNLLWNVVGGGAVYPRERAIHNSHADPIETVVGSEES